MGFRLPRLQFKTPGTEFYAFIELSLRHIREIAIVLDCHSGYERLSTLCLLRCIQRVYKMGTVGFRLGQFTGYAILRIVEAYLRLTILVDVFRYVGAQSADVNPEPARLDPTNHIRIEK